MRRAFAIFLSSIFILAVFSSQAAALTTRAGDMIIIDDTVEDDLYLAGENIIISGNVMGDVVVAGGRIEVRGNITQDLTVMGSEVIITGSVGDDIRIATGSLDMEGEVRDDLILASGESFLSSGSTIGGDLSFTSGQMQMLGSVDGDMMGSGGEITIGGHIGGNADIEAGELGILPAAAIGGNLRYMAPGRITIPEGTVNGEVNFVETGNRDEDSGGIGLFSVIWWIFKYIVLAILALVVLAIWPGKMDKLARETTVSPGKKFLIGLGLILGAWIISVLLLITLIGIPIGVLLLLVIVAVMYFARVITGLWIGKYVFAKVGWDQKPWAELVLGVFILLLLSELPIIGWLVYIVSTLIPLGNYYYELKNTL